MKLIKNSVIIIVGIAALFGMLPDSTTAKPLDILEELTDERIYDRMFEFLDSIGGTGEETQSARQQAVKAEDRCRMPMRKGVCRALIPRFTWNSATQECVEFKFGGCDGNANNFLTEKQCLDVCKGL